MLRDFGPIGLHGRDAAAARRAGGAMAYRLHGL